MSQFTATPSVAMTLTQAARNFKDIVPSHSLARFLSDLTMTQILPMILSALHQLSIPVASPSQSALEGREPKVSIRIKTLDRRQQLLQGSVVLGPTTMRVEGRELRLLEVRFVKAKGDPLGWRRLFKQVAVLCKDAIIKPSDN